MAQSLTQEQIQTQKQEQIQTMSPVQLLLVKLTELSVNELEQCVNKELEENPALEEVDYGDGNSDNVSDNDDISDGDGNSFGKEADLNDQRGDYANEDDMPAYLLASTYSSSEPVSIPFGAQESFYEQLRQQIGEHNVTPHERNLLEYLIGSLDNDGLLRKSLNNIYYELAVNENIETSVEELRKALKILQTFDPIGIAATSLQECLLLQLKTLPNDNPTVVIATKIIEKHYDNFVNKRYERLRQLYKLNDEQFNKVLNVLRHLNPRPGSALNDSAGTESQVVVPDFKVTQDDEGNFLISLNQGEVPVLKISTAHKESLTEYEKNKDHLSRQQREAIGYLKQKLDAARNFINAITQRRETLMRTMTAIVDLQKDFFEEGNDDAIHPMILEDVAKKTGLDKSTISRVTKSKYVETDFGVFPLKYFFNEKFTTSSGDQLSKLQIKNKLKELIDKEDKRNPLSDDELTNKLKKEGFPVARRTVAKYREKLGLPVARLRRT